MKPRKGKVIVSGILFWYPLAGVTYQFLHYLIGLRRLGYDVYYVEDSGRYVYDPLINDRTPDASNNIAAIAPVLDAYGFGDKWAFRGRYEGGECYGLTESQLNGLYTDADAFLNVTGAQELYDDHMRVGCRIYVESDPFAMQVKAAKGHKSTLDMLAAHDLLFTFGENLGAADCIVPVDGFQWLPTRQPVALDLWAHEFAPGKAYRTITTWSNRGDGLEWGGETYYWTKDRNFVEFLELPQRASAPFEIAVSAGEDVCRRLVSNGWHQTGSVELSRDPDCYRKYIQTSRGEFTVARDQYVRPKTGWFSDRSACYLAAGRPVITQETAFSKYLGSGKGLFGFTTIDDAAAAVEAVERDYAGNCRAAREIADEYFDAEKVLGSLMERAGL